MDANRARLLASLDLNSATNVTVHDCALSATPGERIFYASGSSSMWTLVAERGDAEGAQIRCRTLDEVAASSPLPALVKIDAEGAEVDVLRGGRELIADHRPTLLVEFQEEQLLAEACELLPGYDFRQLDVNHWLLA